MVNVDQPQAVASTLPETPPDAAAGFEDFFRASFRELVRAAMYAGATKEEGEDAASKASVMRAHAWLANWTKTVSMTSSHANWPVL